MYNIKFGFASGYNLVFTIFQPDGTGRGTPNQPLYEVPPTGYYRAEALTDPEDGDITLIYNNEILYWESDIVYCLTCDYVFYEGEQVYYEEDWVIDYDTAITDIVTWVGDTVGSGEYAFAVGDISSLVDSIDTLVVGQGIVDVSWDETESTQEGITIAGVHL